ncbi:uncharacterized protein G2W53_038979 [Senna tora]|uniref:Uncharacterized protein n=1 Tax=Senna tora TaxID=362788 RepID=A0A834SPZ1_9FABA|nr:uncharacterized protein G2W53_038979 [Senna tora]
MPEISRLFNSTNRHRTEPQQNYLPPPFHSSPPIGSPFKLETIEIEFRTLRIWRENRGCRQIADPSVQRCSNRKV